MSPTPALPMQIFRAEVHHTRQLTPGMVRVTFAGAGLRDFRSTGVGDEYLRVFFPHPGEREPVLPRATRDSWVFDDAATPAPMRTYTVRDHRPGAGEVDIDFVVHDGGVAAAWAQSALPGDVVGLNTPTGLYDPPADLDWVLLLADATGLPAALRILETLPFGVIARAVLEVPGPEHRQAVPQGTDTEVTWVYGGNGHGPSRLEQIVRSIERPQGVGYVWVAGETRELRGVRRYLRHELRLPASSYKVVGYWTERAEEWRARYESLDAHVRGSLDALWTQNADAEEIEDAYIAQLERLGL